MQKALILSATCLLLVPVGVRGDAVKDELKRLEGTWVVTALEADGKRVPDDAVRARNETFTFQGETMVQRTARPEEHSIPIRIDPSRMPKTIDLGSSEVKGLSNIGIYDVQGNTLTICLSKDRKERPKEFRSGAGINAVLVTCRRQEAKAVWRQVAVVVDGKDLEVGRATLLTVTPEGYSVTVDGQPYQKGTTKTVGGEGSQQSDVIITEGANAGTTVLQFFKIEGDVLIACQAPPGKPRPTSLTSEPGSGHTLSVWLRVR